MTVGIIIQTGRSITQRDLFSMITAEEVVWKILIAIYSHDVLNDWQEVQSTVKNIKQNFSYYV